jgi:murein DD-endopeptidase MepM/ murein hydrolase activator NlpD
VSLFLFPGAGLAADLTYSSAEQVICAKGVALFDNDLRTPLHSLEGGTRAKLFQSWGDREIKRDSAEDGRTYVKVQATSAEKGAVTGWVPEEYLRAPQDCPGAESRPDSLVDEILSGGVGAYAPPTESCCEFPLGNRPTQSYTSGMRAFAARRSGGRRLHAACDLYRQKGDPIRAVTDGKVIRGLYYFYQGTYAIELKHTGGFVVRYGEITGKRAVNSGATVRPGQTVGYMGKTNCCTPMLHFELYSGTKSGPLSTGGNKFQRRADLINPTRYLQAWEGNSFRDRR